MTSRPAFSLGSLSGTVVLLLWGAGCEPLEFKPAIHATVLKEGSPEAHPVGPVLPELDPEPLAPIVDDQGGVLRVAPGCTTRRLRSLRGWWLAADFDADGHATYVYQDESAVLVGSTRPGSGDDAIPVTDYDPRDVVLGPLDELNVLLVGPEGLELARRRSGSWTLESTGSRTLDSTGEGTLARLAVDDRGHRHVIFCALVKDAGCQLRYSTDASGEWKTTHLGSELRMRSDLAIALDAQWALHSVYRSGTPGYLVHSTNRTGAWVHEVVEKEPANIVTLVMDAEDNAEVYYTTRDSLVHGQRTQTGWVVRPLPRAYRGALDRDRAGAVHFVAVDDAAATLLHRTNASGHWEEQALASYPSFPETETDSTIWETHLGLTPDGTKRVLLRTELSDDDSSEYVLEELVCP